MKTAFKFYCSLDVHVYYPEIVLQYNQIHLKIYHICLLMLSLYLGKLWFNGECSHKGEECQERENRTVGKCQGFCFCCLLYLEKFQVLPGIYSEIFQNRYCY